MAKKQPELIVHDFQKGFLTLPFDESQFKDFVTSLLGQPQTISKFIQGKFEIHLKDLQNFHDLIDQRIAQQNNGQLIQLTTQIYFSDNSSVLLSSLPELITYNEVKPIISRQVVMTWTYLIQFNDKSVPEKQEIGLMISTQAYRENSLVERIYHTSSSPIIVETDNGGFFEINVRHTARSWGNDIETLLTNQIRSILKKKEKLRQILDDNYNLVVSLFVAVLSAAGIYALNSRNFFYLKNNQSIVRPIIKGTNMSSKLNYLVNLTAINHDDFLSSYYGLCYFLIVLVSFIAALIIIESVNLKEKSFIILTRESLKNKDEILSKQKNRALTFTVSYVLSIIASIIASCLYAYLNK